MSLVGSASSIPPRVTPSLTACEPQTTRWGGDAEPTRFNAIKDAMLRAAVTAAYDAWESRQAQLSIFSEAA